MTMDTWAHRLGNEYLSTLCLCLDSHVDDSLSSSNSSSNCCKYAEVTRAESESESDESDVDQDVIEHWPEDFDKYPPGLSHIGIAAYYALMLHHPMYKGICWNVSHGNVAGPAIQTPAPRYSRGVDTGGNNKRVLADDLPHLIYDLISQAEHWIDFATLQPPDGKFLDAITKGLRSLAETGKCITVRFLTGNILGMPVDSQQLLERLTKNPVMQLPTDSNLRIWAGSWRKGTSWNHSKILAVDGKHLITGGHNLSDAHYLQKNPIHDISVRFTGEIAEQGHMFANRMWKFIIKQQKKRSSQNGVAGWTPRLPKSRCSLDHWPKGVGLYPPEFKPATSRVPFQEAFNSGHVPMISIGRYGSLHHCRNSANPSDSAIAAMLVTAVSNIKMSLEDLGPEVGRTEAGPYVLPGGRWPYEYLDAIAKGICQRGVLVHIVLSNPCAAPGGLDPKTWNFGNGWSCADVATEIAKRIKVVQPNTSDEMLQDMLRTKLFVAYVRDRSVKDDDQEHEKVGNHAKFFAIDDTCCYIGSQNLSVSDMCEFGVVIDNSQKTQYILQEYWDPLWAASFGNIPNNSPDFDVDDVLAGCAKDRDGLIVEGGTLCKRDNSIDDGAWPRKRNSKMGYTNKSLVVWVHDAHEIREKKAELFVEFCVCGQDGNMIGSFQSTESSVNTPGDPEWNEMFEFEGLENPNHCTLHMRLRTKQQSQKRNFASDEHIEDDCVGSAKLHLGSLRRARNYQYMELFAREHGDKFEGGLDERIDGCQSTSVCISLNTRGRWGKRCHF